MSATTPPIWNPSSPGLYPHIPGRIGARGAGGTRELEESRATLRGLLRDYRDKTSHYLNILRGDLNAAALALEEILDSLGQIPMAIRETSSAKLAANAS